MRLGLAAAATGQKFKAPLAIVQATLALHANALPPRAFVAHLRDAATDRAVAVSVGVTGELLQHRAGRIEQHHHATFDLGGRDGQGLHVAQRHGKVDQRRVCQTGVLDTQAGVAVVVETHWQTADHAMRIGDGGRAHRKRREALRVDQIGAQIIARHGAQATCQLRTPNEQRWRGGVVNRNLGAQAVERRALHEVSAAESALVNRAAVGAERRQTRATAAGVSVSKRSGLEDG